MAVLTLYEQHLCKIKEKRLPDRLYHNHGEQLNISPEEQFTNKSGSSAL